MDVTYKEKEMRLLQSLIERNGMQYIIDTAAEVFGKPPLSRHSTPLKSQNY